MQPLSPRRHWVIAVAATVVLVTTASCTSRTVVGAGHRPVPAPTAAPTPSPTGTPLDAATSVDDDSPGEFRAGPDQVEALVSDCRAGSDMACDILYQVSDLDSPEEDLALDCGGRGPSATGFCTADVDPDGSNLWFANSSPGLGTIADRCRAGDMTACDFLYFRSAIASSWEEIGNGCGGRVEVAVPDCRTRFPD